MSTESLRVPPGYSWLDLTLAAKAPYKEADRLWFEAHPQRSFRIRRPIAGEPLPLGEVDYVVLRQDRPGVRSKRFVFLNDGPKQHLVIPDLEHVAMALWLVLDSHPPLMKLSAIKTLARSLASAELGARQ